MFTPERRITSAGLTLRSAPAGSDSPGILCGYAAVFNILSRDLGGFVERLLPGCFDRVLANVSSLDVRCLANHDPSRILGRTKSHTLSLTRDNTGLWFECALPNTSVGKDIATLNARGDLNECSFAFKCEDGDDVMATENGKRVRTVKNVSELFDVSAVTYPAYPGTSAMLRSFGERPIDYRSVWKGLPSIEVLRARAEFWGEKIAMDDEAAAEADRARTLRYDPYLDKIIS